MLLDCDQVVTPKYDHLLLCLQYVRESFHISESDFLKEVAFSTQN